MTPNVVTTVLSAATPEFAGGKSRDLCSLEEVREELDLGDRRADRWLQKQITNESETVETFCNRIFRAQYYQDHFWPFRDSVPRKFEADLLPLQLARWPIACGTSHAGIAPPRRPSLSAVAGSAPVATVFFVRISYVTSTGETAASLESGLAVGPGQLLQVASPVQDVGDRAIGWNCYIGTSPNKGTLQNASPISIGQDLTLPAAELVPGHALPDYVLVVEEGIKAPDGTISARPLAEGVDFTVNAEEGQIIRLHPLSRHARSWSSWPLIIQYRGGFDEVPHPVRMATVELVKFRWFARKRDPGVKSENVEGIYQADYWLGTGPGGPADMPSFVADRLDRYRVPVIA
ncbi:hypothetical protein CWB41_13985 [Methylovirgula ligni]|uniref:Uncharacterized protein n=1 Tax=Methylovirgula ligni TaxID=569860 RepID=A0A3D9YL32_9HYPH|nr:hypothetical protein [Methylovirgula ligni]QAY96703.1 hypothetical protein CWB41_13985 [Methylovirgula ligni]REF83256.1 hypothetical protein DES32_3172 [Methylovirgula ligni]